MPSEKEKGLGFGTSNGKKTIYRKKGNVCWVMQ